jgi:hypothetical protein
MKFFRFLPLALLCSFAFADENLPVCGSEQALPGASCRGRDVGLDANQRISVYLHPFTMVGSLATKEIPFLLYLTGEYPLSRFNSLIINPSLWSGKSEDLDFFRIGTGIGIRRFANGEANGLYLQLMPSLHYLSVEEGVFWGDVEIAKVTKSGSVFDILGYIGYSAKYSGISVYFDVGIGYGWVSLKGGERDKDNIIAFAATAKSGKGLAFDVNVGIGIPLF